MALHLTAELLKHKRLQETLKSEFPEADDETLEDTLDGLTELTEIDRGRIALAPAGPRLDSGFERADRRDAGARRSLRAPRREKATARHLGHGTGRDPQDRRT